MSDKTHIKKYSSIDKKHPILSRCCLQIIGLTHNTTLSAEIKNSITEFCFTTVLKQLETIWETTEKINDEYYNKISQFTTNSNNYFPYLDDLQKDIEIILYATKKILRDLSSNIISPLFPKFKNMEGGSFSSLKTGESEYSIFIRKEFNDKSKEYKNSIQYSMYLSEIIAKRNAIEHPGGKSGTLSVFQPEIQHNLNNSTITRLYWARNGVKTDLLIDLYDICLNLLFFIEYILINIIIKPNLLPSKKLIIIPGNKLKLTNNIKYIIK